MRSFDPHSRVEGTPGVLEDGLDGAAVGAAVARIGVVDVFALEEDAALGGFLQHQEELGGGALAAAGLADNTQGLAPFNLERDAVHGLEVAGGAGEEQALGDGEVLLQVADFQQRRLPGGGLGSGVS